MRYSDFAHPLVREVLDFVEVLEKKWDPRSKVYQLNQWKHIEYLILFLKSNEKGNEIFRYFAAAVIYSECIVNSFQTSKTRSQNLGSSLFLPDELKQRITIPYLNDIAREIKTELLENTFLKDQRTDIQRKADREFEIRDTFGGQLPSILSESNIPYLKVFANHESEVCIRNGGAFINRGNSAKYKFQRAEQKIWDFPCRFFRSGSYDPVYKGKKSLVEVFGNHEDLVTSTLFGKYITSINVHLPNNNQHKRIYEINTAESNITQSAECRKLNIELCEGFAGIRKEHMFSSSRKYTQKDVIITYFSSKLYKKDGIELNHEQLDLWCSVIIQSYFSLKRDNEMYIGFCYQTILDGYYSDKYSVPGSTTLLLLALTRGLEELGKNNTLGENHQPVTNENSDRVESNFNFATWLQRIFKKKENSPNPEKIPSDNLYKLQEIKESQGSDRKFLGATSRGITIKKSFPWVRLIVLLLIGFIPFAVYAIFMFQGTNLNSRIEFVRLLGTCVEVASSLTAIVLLLVKLLFFRKWELSDMLRDRIRTRSLKELCVSISPNRMEKMARAIKLLARDIRQGRMPTQSLTEFRKSISPNRMEKKARAIKLLATIPNPKDVFSWHHSCAFVDGGCGEFEIDADIMIEDLRDAGYKFGVNYYGQPIVADTRAQVRSVEFPKDEEEKPEEKKTVHISGLHEWQPKYIFELPTNNLTVAGTNSSSSFSDTISDYV